MSAELEPWEDERGVIRPFPRRQPHPARIYGVGPVHVERPETPAPSMGPLHADAHPTWRLWAGNVALGIRLVVLAAVCAPVIAGGVGAFLLIMGWIR